MDDHAGALRDQIRVQLERVRAVFECVGRADRLGRQLARAARRHEADAGFAGRSRHRGMNPRASAPSTRSHPFVFTHSARSVTVCRSASASASSGVKSFEPHTGCRKSGTSRILRAEIHLSLCESRRSRQKISHDNSLRELGELLQIAEALDMALRAARSDAGKRAARAARAWRPAAVRNVWR